MDYGKFFAWSEQDLRIAGKFIFFFAVSFAAINSAISLADIVFFETLFAAPTSFFLSLMGFQNTLATGAEPVTMNIAGLDNTIAFTYLCTGLLEWIIITSAILASTEAKAGKRIAGVVFATIGVFAFNLFRINASILSVLFLGLETAAFSHDIFFRAFLFVSIAGFYWAWLRYAQKRTA
ncbi:MAG: exosortase/archaeosortase family protein [Candidatus Diapherotrites archaeon]|nr:exosortase/archaeosortase family protein [Candidatus Diapherotrites archaeon]